MCSGSTSCARVLPRRPRSEQRIARGCRPAIGATPTRSPSCGKKRGALRRYSTQPSASVASRVGPLLFEKPVRNFGALDDAFDVVVIGGGASGLGAAVDAVSRGYK